MRQDPRTIINHTEDPGLTHSPIVTPKSAAKNIYNWRPDKPDLRDYRYSLTAPKAANFVDLRPYCSPVEDQGNLGSCTGNAIAGAIELLNDRNNRPNDVSRLFIYYYERLIEGTVNYDSGAYIRDGIKATYTYGASLEKYWPYAISKYKLAPTAEAISDGARRKVTLYERVASFNGCLDALTRGYPVIIGFLVYSSFERAVVARTGQMPYPNVRTERLLGGHAVLLVGYDTKKQVFIARNSWGTSWGDRGYFYMPFSVIQNPSMSSDFWVIKTVNNP